MIPRKNERLSNPLAGMSPWTWLIASAMAGGIALMASPAQADVSTSAPASQPSSVSMRDGGGDDFGIGGFGFGNRKKEQDVDLFTIFEGGD